MMKDKDETKGLILLTLSDLVTDFLCYSRKEDEDLPRYAIEKAVIANEISIEEMAEYFADCLRTNLRTEYLQTIKDDEEE